MVLPKIRLAAAAFLVVSLVLAGFWAACQPIAGEKPLVVTTTSVLGSVVKDLAGDQVEVVILVNPAICPAHYDVKPSDVYAVSEAELILYHGMEGWLKQLYETSGSHAVLVKISGDWATVDGIKHYYQEVAEALSSKLGLDVSKRLEQRLGELEELAQQILHEAESRRTSSVKVIVMSWQKGFLKWMGFNVVGEFGPPEKLSSADIEKLIAIGRENDVGIIVSNLQSGTEVGETLARELGAVHVVLSNFPESDPETKTLIDLMKKKADKLLEAVTLLNVKKALSKAESEIELYQALAYTVIIIAAIEAAALVYLLTARRRKHE